MAKLGPIKLNQEVDFTGTIKFDNLDVYKEVIKATMPMSLEIAIKQPCPPYEGRVPRFALWGARGRIIQVGSKEDAAWYRRVRRKQVTLEFIVPKVDFGPEVRLGDRGKPITFTYKDEWRP